LRAKREEFYKVRNVEFARQFRLKRNESGLSLNRAARLLNRSSSQVQALERQTVNHGEHSVDLVVAAWLLYGGKFEELYKVCYIEEIMSEEYIWWSLRK
jgi:transcriptional regulator with XRE-family HTH domain